jgi:[acyl-carrier-protein] S-malonyltransferase
MMKTALTFPGQGSQQVGMGLKLAEAFPASRAVFEEVDEALGQKLSALMWEGPEDQLTLTENAQPALLAVSIAALRALESEAGFDVKRDASFVAGHSLGEYSALTAAGAFSLADAARLLRLRGQSMQQAVPVGEGAMAAVLGLDLEPVIEVCREAGADQVQVANDNAAGQVVISGVKAAVEKAAEIAKSRGAKRAIMLPVSAPFHCALMQPAADVMAGALAQTAISDPVVPLVANVTAAPIATAGEVRQRLVEQVTGTVRWRESVAFLVAAGMECILELGAGKVLTGIAKRMAPEAQTIAIGTPDDVQAYIAARG